MEDYPASLDIEYPPHGLNRLTTLLRPIVAFPIVIVLALVTGPTVHAGSSQPFEAGGLIVLGTALMLSFRQKYPRWWFEWNMELTK